MFSLSLYLCLSSLFFLSRSSYLRCDFSCVWLPFFTLGAPFLRSLGTFGALLDPLGAQSDSRPHFVALFFDFWGPLGSQVAPKRAPGSPKEPKSAPNGAQSGPKRYQKWFPNRIFRNIANPCFVRLYNDFHGFLIPGGCPGTPKS